jgi:hypothetical protein
MDNNYCMKAKTRTRNLDNVWTVMWIIQDLCLLAFGENMSKMTSEQ